MSEMLAVIATWTVAIVCIKIMHRIQPEDKIYNVLVIFNALIVTIVVIYSKVI